MEQSHPLQTHFNYHISLEEEPVKFDPNKGITFWDETNRLLIIINDNELIRITAPNGDVKQQAPKM